MVWAKSLPASIFALARSVPERNGKIERSHRIDQEKFFRNLSFYSLRYLREQGAMWNKRYNETPAMVDNWKKNRVSFIAPLEENQLPIVK